MFVEAYVREMRKRLEDVEKNLRQSPTPNVERDLRQQNDYLTASETRFRQQLDDLKSQNRDLRKQLDDTNYKLQLKSKQLSDMQQEIDKHRKDAKSAAVSLEAQLKDSMERERVLAGKVEQAAVIEKLLREEVRLAVQDERTQMTSAPNNKTGAMYNDEGSQVVSGSGYLVALLDTLRVSSVAVYGVTVLRDKLYIARDRSNIIEVFDVNTLSPCCRRLPVNHSSLPQQVRPLDIAACSETSSIYLSDAANCRLHRVDPSTGDVVNSWRVDSRALWGVSVTGSGTAVVCCRGAGLLCEYTSSGQLVRRVRLPDDVSQPVHAVQLGSSSPLFAVSHYDVDEPSGSGARVCVVDETGTVQRALDRLSQPHHLATFSDDGRCLMAVADCGNDRVKLVDVRDLSVVAVVGGDGYLRHPHRLCVSNSRLYIGLWDGRVLVYQLSSSRITGVSQVAHLPV